MLRGPYRKSYTPAQMHSAVEAVRGGMGLREAVRRFGVPKTSLLDRTSGRIDCEVSRSGPQPVLTPAEEAEVVQYVKGCGRAGYPLDKNDLKNTVKTVLDADGRDTPFKDNRPGKLQYSK